MASFFRFIFYILIFTYTNKLFASYADIIDIPFTKYTLANGLTLIVHEDNKAPIVSVNVWYHVGSKNESVGKTGFAHLFEHLMFNGSENYNDEWFIPLQEAGATDINGTTWFDRTNYFQTIPVSALDRVLWLESDRMGHFINAVTQERLDEQREVVINEKKQKDNKPYGKSDYKLLASIFPHGHPYSWSTIGSFDDINNASLDDARKWFNTYYGAANATIVIAGDVEAKKIKEKVDYYFGHIKPGPMIDRAERWIAKRHESKYDIMFDNVPQSRITRTWNTAPFGDEDAIVLNVIASILGQGKNSRLYKRLVYDEKIATSISVNQQSFEISGIFEIEAYLKPQTNKKDFYRILDEEINLLLKDDISFEELDRTKTMIFSNQLRSLEKIGGFSGKAQTLARYQVYLDDASRYKFDLKILDNLTPNKIKDVARKWLGSGDYNLEIHPKNNLKSQKPAFIRDKMPDIGIDSKVNIEKPIEIYLSNGLRMIHQKRGDLPFTEILLQFEGGFSSDPKDKLGLASITAAMLDEGSVKNSSLEIAKKIESLGAKFNSRATLDSLKVSISSLNENLEKTISLFIDIIKNPSFPDFELERVKSNWLDRINQEKSSPFSIALRNLPKLLYGDKHPYGIPFTGTGEESSIKSITRNDLIRFHKKNYSLDNATLIVVGNIETNRLVSIFENKIKHFNGKKINKKNFPKNHINITQNIEAPIPINSPTIYLIDKKNASQSLILGGQLLPPSSNETAPYINMAIDILGGTFTSRINMNLREDKGWTYGAKALTIDALRDRPLFYYAPVQSDKTVDSLLEFISETQKFKTSEPPNKNELERFKSSYVRSLPGNFETNTSYLSALSEIIEFGRDLDYIMANQKILSMVNVNDLVPVISDQIQLDKTIWLIVGDLDIIEQPLRDKDIYPVVILNN